MNESQQSVTIDKETLLVLIDEAEATLDAIDSDDPAIIGHIEEAVDDARQAIEDSRNRDIRSLDELESLNRETIENLKELQGDN